MAVSLEWTSQGASMAEDDELVQDGEENLVLHHYDLVCSRFGVERGTLLMRKFACSYAQGIPGARDFRGHVSRVTTRPEFLDVVRRYFPKRVTD